MLYAVMFNLNDKETDYTGLFNVLHEYDQSRRILDSVWLISSDDEAAEIFEDLHQFFDGDGDLFVAELLGDNYQLYLDKDATRWTDKMYERVAR